MSKLAERRNDEFRISHISTSFFDNSRNITELTRKCLEANRLRLLATLTTVTTAEKILMTGILEHGTLTGEFISDQKTATYTLLHRTPNFDPAFFARQLAIHFQTNSVGHVELVQRTSGLMVPDFSRIGR